MALLDVRKRQAIQEVVDRWRERCLLEDGSLLFDDEQVWTPENLALLLDPSYVRATAIVLDKQRVQPSGRNGRPLGRATKLNERARYELRRLGQTDQFVVWRVVLLR